MKNTVLFCATAVLCGLSSTAIAAERDARSRTDGFGEACTLDGDVDEDGNVGIRDYMALLSAYGSSDPTYDLDADGVVGTSDLMRVLSSYGQTTDSDLCRGISLPKNYYFNVSTDPMDDDTGFIYLNLSAYWRDSIRNMRLCWGPEPLYGSDLCDSEEGGSEINLTDSSGHDLPWVTASDQYIGNKRGHGIALYPETLLDLGLDPIECGVAYTFRIRNGIWFDEVEYQRACPPPCTECPYGGSYDGANCFVGTAPDGSNAGYNATLGVWTYTPDSGNCGDFDETLRDGSCVWADVPEGADAFAYGPTNGFYTAPECE